ncbi:hypothetical protein E4665_02170 [Sporolactobacillus shoreae]|uniref:Uncharacterized protein n=1 Tax=Sporolactobacillus shoreae TaxID=1465501 RepID=A0A4Z0GR30_9BACL|nr:hypothetical protein [Sporolactobacillus shoreae]TGA99779.1 hypothetical protein E4665_02170 [Sporolactobacillus shoreae]
MYSWRITKYDPAKRNQDGSYADAKEWTSYSDIGKSVSEDEYLRTEENYLNAIKAFAEELAITEVSLSALDGNSTEDAINLFKIWLGKKISLKDAVKLARLVLREDLWCKMEVPDYFFVHFGYDYYMYIGAYKDCPAARKKTEASGLFVESFASPYL